MVLFVLWKYKNIHCFLASLVAQQVKDLSTCHGRVTGDLGLIPGIRKIPWRRAWWPTPVFLPGESHGQRSLEGYSPQGCKESDTAEATEHTCTRTFFHVDKKKKKRKEKLGTSYGLNVHPKLTCWNFTSQCDAIRRWGLEGIIKIRWGHKVEDLMNGLIPVMRKPASPLSFLPSEDTIKN